MPQRKKMRAESARRENNYNKLVGFYNYATGHGYDEFESLMDSLWGIYNESIVPFEDTDDTYAKEVRDWNPVINSRLDFSEELAGLDRAAWDCVVAAGAGIMGTLKTICSLCLYLEISTYALEHEDTEVIMPEFLQKNADEVGTAIRAIPQLLKDPRAFFGAMGQMIMDTLDEDGIGYAVGVVLTSLAGEYALEKAIGKAKGLLRGAAVIEDIEDAGETASRAERMAGGQADDAMKHFDEAAQLSDEAAAASHAGGNAGEVYEPRIVDDIIEGGSGTFKYKEVKTFTAEETNQWFIDNIKPDYKPPYKPGIVVKEIELIENTTFVRVYDNMPDGSGMYGSWIMKAEDIEGLTPLEIQNRFALPNAPKYV